VHVAKRELRLDDAGYRTILQTQGGAQSSAEMNVGQLQQVVAYMKRSGFKVTVKDSKAVSGPRAAGTGRRILAGDAESRKARAMWLTLHAIGQVRDPSESALLAYTKRQCKVDRLEWVRDVLPLIESLKAWLLRSLPHLVEPYLTSPLESWAGHMAPAWRDAWAKAVRSLRDAQFKGNVQLVDKWLDLWELVGSARARV
jgi:hypothetical protein